MALTKIAKID